MTSLAAGAASDTELGAMKAGTKVTSAITVAGVSMETAVAGDGSPLVVVHGLEGVPPNRAVVDRLAECFRVFIPTQPGFDESGRPDWLDSVEDLAYLNLEYLEHLDLQDVTLVGFQFGGWIAAEMAVRCRDRLSSLVLVSPVGIKIGERTDRDIEDIFSICRADYARATVRRDDRRVEDLSGLESEELLRIARNEEAAVMYGWEPYMHNPRLRRWLSRIRVPSMVIAGEDDGILSTRYPGEFAAALDAELKVLPGAAHQVQVDAPDGVAELIAGFAARAQSARS